ncbi:MAG: xanthine dehydrogenase family protein molybdopterin-binding subunit [Betaproteobacteria bacterium]|nr:xanthine dehydrogenase family protein molybdopterin-binding subunit [Betaproteobacteria bacterium]
MVGMQNVAFVRSSVAHGRIKSITKPAGLEDLVFTIDDLIGVKPIVANSALPGFKASSQPVLAQGKVRFVGEMIAMCVATTRAEAEDIAALVEVDIEPLPAVTQMLMARNTEGPRVHEHWSDNVFLETKTEADLTDIKATAAIKVRRRIHTARQCMAPMEGRGVVATFERRLDQLLMYSSAQMPHINRAGLSECLGIDQGRIRVVSPDVGGGFGYKALLLAEEVCLAWLAMRLQKPVRWIEDRYEQLSAGANCREHDYDITGYADTNGRLLAVDCDATVDSGAYSLYPFSACLEAAQVGSILPGPYVMEKFRCVTASACTNKPPILPYRGVARTGVCFAIELLIDAIAREAKREPYEVRLTNLVPPEKMPFWNVTKKYFDSGDYPEAVRRAVTAIDLSKWRARQQQDEPDGRRIGVGFSVYCEQAAHGTSVYYGWGIPMVPGHEQCNARLSPDGVLEVRIGAHSHGQGLETTLAQVANSILGIDTENVRVIHGDTAVTPYSTGTWGSRCMVMSGGAVGVTCKEIEKRVRNIAAKLMEVAAVDLVLADGEVRVAGTDKKMTLKEVAHVWYRQPQLLPPDVDTGGLEATLGYKPLQDTGTFSYACHAVVVAVDTELGAVEILDYVIVEDGGTLINPMVVDGQIFGGTAQGIGTALYEEMPFDLQGQPLASTLADYMLPGATEVPPVRVLHMETPSPLTFFGQKGIGEGGAIAPPAAIANAVNDALAPLGVEMLESPITSRRLLAALAKAGTVAARA